MRKAEALVFILLIVLAGVIVGGAAASKASEPPYWIALYLPTPSPPSMMPIVFVHGGAGSAQQFMSQAMRFTSNGYPPEYLVAFEYDSSFTVENLSTVLARLDATIDQVRAATGSNKVILIGHSLGTYVSLNYLSAPGHCEKVAYYINIDGSSGRSAPALVPTLAIWTNLSSWRSGGLLLGLVGATKNIWFYDQTHTDACTSAETFAEIFRFINWKDPATTNIVPETSDYVNVSGRVVIFPYNTYNDNVSGTLEIWEVNSSNGHRLRDSPDATFSITGPNGKWGPFQANRSAYYEFVLLREDRVAHHFYFEPFTRSNYWLTLLTSAPGGIADQVNRSDSHTSLLIIRNKEFWGDQGSMNDVLKINGTNVITPMHCPVTKLVCGIWVYDKDSDGQSDLNTPIQQFHSLLFQTGVDLYIEASTTDPPDGVITLELVSRGGKGTHVINVPNWPSSNHSITVHFNDYEPNVGSSQCSAESIKEDNASSNPAAWYYYLVTLFSNNAALLQLENYIVNVIHQEARQRIAPKLM